MRICLRVEKKMPINKNRLSGEMIVDYFSFFCPKCKQEITSINFTHLEESIPMFSASCNQCNRLYNFKMNMGGINWSPYLPEKMR
jgi:hypothetical protein